MKQIIARMRNIKIAPYYFVLPYALLSLFYLGLALNLPVSIYSTAIHDDAWFIQNAENILKGRWLGDYSQMTLIKGPGYAYFLALNKLLHLPIALSIACLYIFACLFTAYIFRIAGASALLTIVLFTVLLFEPSQFPMRIIRDNIYPALTLITISGLAYIAINHPSNKNRILIILAGTFSGLFWITREEGLWIIPGALVLMLYGCISRIKKNCQLIIFLKNLAIFYLFALTPIFITIGINYIRYHSTNIVETKGTNFVRAINAINSVDIGQEIPFLPASHQKRQAIYQISPSFSELRTYFDVDGKAWTQPGCAMYPHTCGDYASGWFMWALRDGVSKLGYYESSKKADDFYNQILREVENACKENILKCNDSFLPYAPQINTSTLNNVVRSANNAINLTLYHPPLPLIENASWGPAVRLSEIRSFLGEPKIVEMMTNINQPLEPKLNFALSCKAWLIEKYQFLSPFLFFSAILFFNIHLIFSILGRLKLSFLFIFSASLWILYFSRILLITLIDISSFPAVNHLYLMPAYPLLTCASITSLVAFFYSMLLSKKPNSN